MEEARRALVDQLLNEIIAAVTDCGYLVKLHCTLEICQLNDDHAEIVPLMNAKVSSMNRRRS